MTRQSGALSPFFSRLGSKARSRARVTVRRDPRKPFVSVFLKVPSSIIVLLFRCLADCDHRSSLTIRPHAGDGANATALRRDPAAQAQRGSWVEWALRHQRRLTLCRGGKSERRGGIRANPQEGKTAFTRDLRKSGTGMSGNTARCSLLFLASGHPEEKGRKDTGRTAK